jgi:hypothetical protein
MERKWMHRLKSFAVIVVLTVNGGALGQSADAPTSRLNAYECETLPKPLRLTVQVLDNAERFLKIKDQFEKALRTGGTAIAADAPAVLTLDIRTVREFREKSAGPLLELRAGQEKTEDIGREGTVFFRGSVWSNRGDSVLGGPKRRSGQLSLNQLQVTASLNRRNDGRCLWQGEILHNLAGDNADNITLQIMTILADTVGKTVRNKGLNIYP